MNKGNIYTSFCELKKQQKKGFAVLVDPDNIDIASIANFCKICIDAKVDYLFIGGSLMVSNQLDACLLAFKKHCSIPLVLFPGSPSQISKHADALLYLSLISGRNPELLIGVHVVSAPMVKQSGLEVISTGYMVIDGGKPTTVSYMSHAAPIPHDKNDIALCTALAGEMQGKHVLYMDAGSGAKKPISTEMIAKVAQNTNIPLIVGGGIGDPEKAYINCKAGADIIVVGNAIEKDVQLIFEIASAVHQCSVNV